MFCVFFFISKKIILKKHKRTKTTQRIQRGEQKRKKKRKEKNKKTKTQENQQRLITKKRTKEHRDRITRGESPSPRPIEKSATKVSKQLIIDFVPILKSASVTLPPNAPHKAQRS